MSRSRIFNVQCFHGYEGNVKRGEEKRTASGQLIGKAEGKDDAASAARTEQCKTVAVCFGKSTILVELR